MIETVHAERFDHQAAHGRTEPLFLSCRRASGESIDVVAKFTWAHCTRGGLTREVIASLLLQDLGIPAATPLLVEFDDFLADSLQLIGQPQLAARVRSSVTPAYGSKVLGTGYALCTEDSATGSLGRQAADAWAFDQLILNPDRRPTKPNCLTNGMQIALIDHELALDVVGIGILVPAPWATPLTFLGSESEHVFERAIKGRGFDLGELEQRWRGIGEERIRGYAACVPAAWNDGTETLKEIVEYLAALQMNLSAAFDRLRKVLS
ncbi:HipA family kinase [Tahibacter soli]|uniref:HipA-like kinase domain-containing protein n=1 Tax=Tahibacter soli TaxID=2983605 RepID=A0A9X3YK37_9GAMM|nr:HipA family kinase [Tahibacter soli]MDC8013869.1 hypothetical protein [Tahibacter soli]